jgi:hypothetical protein
VHTWGLPGDAWESPDVAHDDMGETTTPDVAHRDVGETTIPDVAHQAIPSRPCGRDHAEGQKQDTSSDVAPRPSDSATAPDENSLLDLDEDEQDRILDAAEVTPALIDMARRYALGAYLNRDERAAMERLSEAALQLALASIPEIPTLNAEPY